MTAQFAKFLPKEQVPDEDVIMHEQPAANEVLEDKLDVE